MKMYIILFILSLFVITTKGRARAGEDMFITCKIKCEGITNSNNGINLICVRKSFKGSSCRTQKKYGCGFGEHILKNYDGTIVSAAKTKGCYTDRDKRILSEQNVSEIKMNSFGTLKLDTGKRFMIINGGRCNEEYCNK
uniref:DUF2845 domain-containing protein n=1 Tax=Parastrongyloides trichosuri TaxID=131310 RepID=A0A0N4ZA63_PARTI